MDTMAKYRVHLGSLVTKLMNRKFVVSADSEEEAIEKAERLFLKAAARNRVYTDVCGSIEVDGIEIESE